jgi:hypothetical protein
MQMDLAVKRIEAVPESALFAFGRTSPVVWSSPAPAPFVARNGGTWSHRVSGPTQDFRTVYGSGVSVDPAAIADPQAALVAVRGFFGENPELLPHGVFVDDLEVVSNLLMDGMRFVALRQTIRGAPVVGTSVYAAIIAGRLVLAGVRAYPVVESPVRLFPKVALAPARLESLALRAASNLGIRTAAVTESRVEVLPLAELGGLVLRPVARLEIEAPFNRFTAFLDPSTGEVVALRDNKQFFDATVMLRHHERNPDPNVPLVNSPAEHLLVQVGKNNLYTDDMGLFTFGESVSSFSAQLTGKYVDVRNAAGADYEFSVSSANPLSDGGVYTVSETKEYDLAQIDAYVFASIVRDFAKEYASRDLPFFHNPIRVNVNVNVDLSNNNKPDYCNAYFDGNSLNFLPEGTLYGSYTCNNTAMISDIVYHEYGHALHYQSAAAGGGSFDEAVSEGFSDTIATAITGDSVLGRFFLKTGQGIRDLNNDLVWPDDQSQDPHQTGLILGGAIWDLRQTFQAKFGQEDGDALTNTLFGSALATSTDMLSVFESFLLADDDNGNLADGTPNFCEIFGAFARHGLASEDIGRITVSHVPLANIAPSLQPIVIEADVAEGAEDCSTLGEVRVVYSTDEGATWTPVSAQSQGGDAFRAVLSPVIPAGNRLLYRIEAVDVDSGLVTKRPSNPAEPYYMVYVGDLEQIAFDDFEEEDPEWTHELVSGRNRETSNDWSRAKPRGDAGDPSNAYSGEYIWGNDLRPKITWDGKYDPDIHNALISPAYDLTDYDNVRLQFRRFLTVEDGYFDQARVLVNEVPVWNNVASPGGDKDPHTLHHIDKEWILFDLDISEYAAGRSDVRIRFELASDQGLQMGGWNLDDFALYTARAPKADSGPDNEFYPDNDAELVDEEAEQAITAMAGGCGCTATGQMGRSFSLLSVLRSFL